MALGLCEWPRSLLLGDSPPSASFCLVGWRGNLRRCDGVRRRHPCDGGGGVPQAQALASSPWKRAPGRSDRDTLGLARWALAARRRGVRALPGGMRSGGSGATALTVQPGGARPSVLPRPLNDLQGRAAERARESAARRSQKERAHQFAARARARVLPGCGLCLRR